jgi:hypothetical protein
MEVDKCSNLDNNFLPGEDYARNNWPYMRQKIVVAGKLT